MKKFFKTSAIVLTIALSLGIAVFAVGCGKTNEYTVKLVYEDGSAYTNTNTTVQFCVVEVGGNLGACATPKNIGENGVCVISKDDLPELKDGESYHIQINKLSSGCSYDEDAANLVVKTPTTITIVIKK